MPSSSKRAHENSEEEKSIDYSSVGLYLAGLQVCFAVVCCACTSFLCCWVLQTSGNNTVRTLALTSSVGLVLVRSPVRVGRVCGVSTVFNALRPMVPLYLLALVLEQLTHVCLPPDADPHAWVRRALFHLLTFFMVCAGLARARNPRSESDWPFLVASSCLLVAALLPPPPAAVATSPLRDPASLLDAGERSLRALLFSSVYASSVYAAAPKRNETNELLICVVRATAASLWTLCVTSWALPLAPFQIAISLFSRLGSVHEPGAVASEWMPANYEHVPLVGSPPPLGPGGGGVDSDIELGSELSESDTISKLALASVARGGGLGGGGAWNFNFSTPARAAPPQSVNLAAIVAREESC